MAEIQVLMKGIMYTGYMELHLINIYYGVYKLEYFGKNSMDLWIHKEYAKHFLVILFCGLFANEFHHRYNFCMKKVRDSGIHWQTVHRVKLLGKQITPRTIEKVTDKSTELYNCHFYTVT